MPKLSIVVPVYGVEPYLPKCIDSILNQTYRDFELILVDDGSPDSCGAICEEYAARDGRIHVIHQENQGVSAARNAGLDMARGEYLGFVDPDDWIQPEMYATLISALEENQADVAACGFQYVSQGQAEPRPGLTNAAVYDRMEMLAAVFGKPNPFGGGNCNKLFRRSKNFGVRFPRDIKVGEDWVYQFASFLNCGKLVKLGDVLYNVYEREDSASRVRSPAFAYHVHLAGRKLIRLCRGSCPELEGAAVDKYLDNCLLYLPEMAKSGKAYHQSYRWKKMKIKLSMLRWTLAAWLGRKLPKAAIHGYLHEWVKL